MEAAKVTDGDKGVVDTKARRRRTLHSDGSVAEDRIAGESAITCGRTLHLWSRYSRERQEEEGAKFRDYFTIMSPLLTSALTALAMFRVVTKAFCNFRSMP